MQIIQTKKAKSIREWVSFKLVSLASWIYPDNEAVTAFYAQLIHDELIYGHSVVRMNPQDLIISKNDEMYKQNKKGDWIKQNEK